MAGDDLACRGHDDLSSAVHAGGGDESLSCGFMAILKRECRCSPPMIQSIASASVGRCSIALICIEVPLVDYKALASVMVVNPRKRFVSVSKQPAACSGSVLPKSRHPHEQRDDAATAEEALRTRSAGRGDAGACDVRT